MQKLNMKPVTRKPSLPDEVADALRHRLASGEFKPGDRLPTGTELASMFNVSLAVIREAMSRLKHDGMIDTVQGAGAFFSGSSAPRSFRLDEDVGDHDVLRRVFELRQVFEEGAARLAAVRATGDQITQLRGALDEMAVAVEQSGDGFVADKKFHELITEMTGNDLFREFFNFLSGKIASSIIAARSHSALHGVSQEAHDEHRAIYEAIERHDPDAAQAAMFNHVRNASRRLGIDIAAKP
jgi:GntR family transcriptional repressor for pyruvate dehydrogenase complex